MSDGQGCYVYKGRDPARDVTAPIGKEYVEMYGLEPKQGGLWFLDLENQIENKKREGATGLDKMVERGDIVLFVFDFKPSAEDLACLPECEWVYPPENLWSKPK